MNARSKEFKMLDKKCSSTNAETEMLNILYGIKDEDIEEFTKKVSKIKTN